MRSAIAAFAAVALAGGAFAGFVNPLIPGWAQGPNTQYAGWESFSQSAGGANLADQVGSNNFSLFNFAPGAFITGSGNLYGAGSPLYVMLTGGTLGASQSPLDVVFNVSTAGLTINPSSVRLTLFDNMGGIAMYAPTVSDLRYDVPANPLGSEQNIAYSWTGMAPAFAATGWRIEFAASDIHMSLDAARVDLRYAPAPGALALLGVAGIGAGRRRRR